MKHLFKLFSLFGLLIIMSCASNIRSKKYTDDDFNKFKTFAYLPNTSFSIEEFNTSEDKSIEASLIATMNDKMVEKGFSIDTGNPDLLVLLSTSNEIKSNLQNSRNNYEQAPSGGSTSGASPNYAAVSSTDYKRYFSNSEDALYNKPYKKGTLIVQVFSKASKELVWVGIAEDFKAHISDQTLMTRMISEIFEEFPI